MKKSIPVYLPILAALIILGCSQTEPSAPQSVAQSTSDYLSVSDDAVSSTLGVERVEYSIPYDLEDEGAWVICNGELMQGHGIVELHVIETYLPSGDLITRAWVDYQAYDGVWFEELSSGDIWQLTNGHNPFGEVIKENGFYMLHYQWNEIYTNPDHGILRNHLKGHVMVEPDGTVRIERESYRCF